MLDDLPRLNAALRGAIVKLITCLSVSESLEREFDHALLRNQQQTSASTTSTFSSVDILSAFWSEAELPSSAPHGAVSHTPSPTPPPSPVGMTSDYRGEFIGLTPAPRHILTKGARSDLIRKRSTQELGLELPEIVRSSSILQKCAFLLILEYSPQRSSLPMLNCDARALLAL